MGISQRKTGAPSSAPSASPGTRFCFGMFHFNLWIKRDETSWDISFFRTIKSIELYWTVNQSYWPVNESHLVTSCNSYIILDHHLATAFAMRPAPGSSHRKKRWCDGLVVDGTMSFPFLSRSGPFLLPSSSSLTDLNRIQTWQSFKGNWKFMEIPYPPSVRTVDRWFSFHIF